MRVPAGAIYYVGSRRRREVVFTAADRAAVGQATRDIRAMLADQRLPPAVDDARCPNCSLVDACTPRIAAHPAVIRGFFAELFHPNEGPPDRSKHP